MGDLPKDLESMLRLANDLVGQDAFCSLWTHGGMNHVEVNGDGGVVQLWLEDGQWWQRMEIDAEDGLADAWVGDAGTVKDEQRLAYLLAWAAGIDDALEGQPDRMAYLRQRAETGVTRA